MKKINKALHLLEKYAENLSLCEDHWPYDIIRALECINTNIFEPGFTIKVMRQKCNIKGQNFSSRFENYVGFTPRAYITYHRIEASKQLLKKEDFKSLPVNSLGFLVGFEKPSSFSMSFKKRTGTTPREWKQS